jgi:hypothetical protein
MKSEARAARAAVVLLPGVVLAKNITVFLVFLAVLFARCSGRTMLEPRGLTGTTSTTGSTTSELVN